MMIDTRLPSLFEIKYFVEVAGTGNVSRAAERLGIQQSSLSHAIRRLEESLGAVLFLRTKAGVELTKAGQRFLTDCREMLQNWENARHSVSKLESELSGVYTIGAHPSIATQALPTFLPSLLEDYPQLDVRLIHDSSRKITDGIINFEIDFGLVIDPTQHPDLVLRPLSPRIAGCWIRNESRMLRKFEAGEANLICVPEVTITEDLLKQAKKRKIRFKRVIFSTNLEVIYSLVFAGAGAGILPDVIAAHAPDPGFKLLDQLPYTRDQIYLAYRKDLQNSHAAQVLAHYIEEHCKSYPAAHIS